MLKMYYGDHVVLYTHSVRSWKTQQDDCQAEQLWKKVQNYKDSSRMQCFKDLVCNVTSLIC